MKCSWREGNRITLLENGDEYYPAVYAALDKAQHRVILETFIWFEDGVGRQLHEAICEQHSAASKLKCCLMATVHPI